MPCCTAAKVLLIDDDRMDLDHYAGVLRDRGYEAQSCGSYAEGLRRLEAEPFAFLIVSQGGPTFEGRTVLERAKEIKPHIPVLVLTRSVDLKRYLEAMELGAVDYLEKTVQPDDLAWVVETYVRRGALAPGPQSGNR